MNNRSKYWFKTALFMLLAGAVCGPAGGGLMAVGSALFLYTLMAVRRARRLQKEALAQLVARRSFDRSRFVVGESCAEQLFLCWQGKESLDMAVCREERLAGIRYAENTQHLISLYPQMEVCLENRVSFKTIGHFSLGSARVYVSRDWGIAEAGCPVKLDCSVLVHPKLYPSLVQGVQNSMIRTPVSGMHRFRNPGDGAELYEIRDYVSGDPFKKILWSATARSGKLIVRENETEVNIPIMFLLNTSWFLRFGSPRMMFDQLAETALALADSARQEGDPFGFCLYGDAEQTDSTLFMLPDSRKNTLSVLMQTLLNIRAQQTPADQLDIPELEKTVRSYLQLLSREEKTELNCTLPELLIRQGYAETSFPFKDTRRYARLLNQIAEKFSLPVPVLHSRFKAPDTVEKEQEMQEIQRLKGMLQKLLPRVKGHAVFIAAVRPYENEEALLALAHILQSIPAFRHTLIVLYPDYASFAGLSSPAEDADGEWKNVLGMPYSTKALLRLDYDHREAVFKQAIRRAGGILQKIDASQNAVFIQAEVNKLRTIQGGRYHA